MWDLLLSRGLAIALASVGGIVTIGAMILRYKEMLSQESTKTIYQIGYGFMWASVAIFIVAGFRGGWA